MRDLVTEGGKMEFLVENATLELQAKVANSLVIVGLQIKISRKSIQAMLNCFCNQ